MSDQKHLQSDLLKGVSRSFYLSLKFLPHPMRGAASIGYLLARTSDTLADSLNTTSDQALSYLEHFEQQVLGDKPIQPWPSPLLSQIDHLHEKRLLEQYPYIIQALHSLPSSEQKLIHKVLKTIISGQKFDLVYFSNASSENVISLADDAALIDYTQKVAGSVGLFWTELGFLTLGNTFSHSSAEELTILAESYGRGLQMVNILKDLHHDLQMGRCYLPVSKPKNHDELFGQYLKGHETAFHQLLDGLSYASKLHCKRLRIASALPAKIGLLTLDKLSIDAKTFLQKPPKIPRWRVYELIFKQLFGFP